MYNGPFLRDLIPLGLSLIAICLISAAVLLLLALLRCLLRRSRRTPCAEVPEAVDRRPDPCLYSQSFILQFFPGQPVTWDNPDIILTELDGTAISSFDLKPSHDYLVRARIWDASFSPAFGTLVRCSFHGFGFNSPNSQPVELNPDGTQKVAVLQIPPWQNTTAEFHWRTPSTPGHYCLLVECSHPADSNTWNNLGQENTVVRDARRGERVTVDAMITNRDRDRAQQVRFAADTYIIPRRELQLQLRTTPGAGSSPGDGELRFTPRASRGRATSSGGAVRYAYVGKEALLAENAAADRGIPSGWAVTPNGETIELAPGETRTIPVTIGIPATAALAPVSFNITSMPDRGLPGGITIRINVGS